MKVDHLSTYPIGGAANAARRLHAGLLAGGVESRFWYKSRRRVEGERLACSAPLEWSDEGDAAVSWARESLRLGRKLRLKLAERWALLGRPRGLEIFTSPRLDRPTRYEQSSLDGDILHLHWISRLIDYPSFFGSLPTGLPVVWTLHDMNPFTGGCHFSGSCTRYVTQCGRCPQLGRRGRKDLSQRSHALKRQALSGLNLHVVTPSRWLESEARRSSLLKEAHSFRTIPYGLDTRIFRPQDRQAVRRQLRLPPDRLVLGFGAASLETRRKGGVEFLAALQQLRERRDLLCLTFGAGQLPVQNAFPATRHAGFVGQATQLAMLYAAMDVFVLPSLEDNAPQAGLEALACGTPVVAFATGGIPEFVRHGETGRLAQVGNPNDLARQIGELLDSRQQRRALSQRARQLATDQLELGRQTQAYIDLYAQILEARQARKSRAAA